MCSSDLAVRDKIRAYHGVHGDTIEDLADDARKYVDQGFTGDRKSVV